MGFKEEILSLSNQVFERKPFVRNEETTKHSLIIPFIQTLGYDVFNPQEVRPEFTADFGKKKGEKVDYAILNNDKAIIFIEAKAINENLQNHDSQLSRYFNTTPTVKLAILTNGIKYKFFTDLTENNIMDSEPFFELDIMNLNDYSISILQKICKDTFDVGQVSELAKELNNISNINSTLRDLFENPTDDFIRFLVKDLSKDRLTATVIERFRPIVRKSIKDAIFAIVGQGLFKDANVQEEKTIPESNEIIDKKDKQQIVTTQEEIETFEMVKKILIAYGKNVNELNCKSTANYFVIYYKNPNKWFLRINLTRLSHIRNGNMEERAIRSREGIS